MSSGNCKRCGSYNYAQNGQVNWTFCQNCGTVNSAAMPEAAPVNILAAAPERAPVVVADRYESGTVVCAEPLLGGMASTYEGTLLAILPPTATVFGWTILTRRPVESELLRLREAVKEANSRAAKIEAEDLLVRQAQEKYFKEQELEVSKLKSELRRVTDRKEISDSQLEVLRTKTLKLEADIGKIRAAIGSKQMTEILAEAK